MLTLEKHGAFQLFVLRSKFHHLLHNKQTFVYLGDAFFPVLQKELADRKRLLKATRQALNLLKSWIDWT